MLTLTWKSIFSTTANCRLNLCLLAGLQICASAHALPAPGASALARCRTVLSNYCEAIDHIDNLATGEMRATLKNGKTATCDDGKSFNLDNPEEFSKQLNQVDLADVLAIPYTIGTYSLPENRLNLDAGRLRNDAILNATYGYTEEEIEDNLVKVTYGAKEIRFNKKNGAAEALKQVFQDLKKDPAAWQWMQKREFAGTFVYRKIDGTNRLSAHSYGVAIDFTTNEKKDMYWKWSARCRPGTESRCKDASSGKEEDLETIPPKNFDLFLANVVDIFERHGFVWGGKWYHYDTMHFEYRPEFFRPDATCAKVQF